LSAEEIASYSEGQEPVCKNERMGNKSFETDDVVMRKLAASSL